MPPKWVIICHFSTSANSSCVKIGVVFLRQFLLIAKKGFLNREGGRGSLRFLYFLSCFFLRVHFPLPSSVPYTPPPKTPALILGLLLKATASARSTDPRHCWGPFLSVREHVKTRRPQSPATRCIMPWGQNMAEHGCKRTSK